MGFTLLALILPICNDDVLFPAGSSWTMRETHEARVEEHQWRVEEGTEVSEAVRERVPAGAHFNVIRRDGEIHWTVVTTSEEIRIYEEPFALLRYVIKRDLKEGMTWKASSERMSCGIFEEEVECSVTKEEITVPAGSFNAFRIDIANRWKSPNSVWVVPGKGIVKMAETWITSELVKFEEGK